MTDLHMHSRYSEDGEFTPAELVEQCFRQRGTVIVHYRVKAEKGEGFFPKVLSFFSLSKTLNQAGRKGAERAGQTENSS